MNSNILRASCQEESEQRRSMMVISSPHSADSSAATLPRNSERLRSRGSRSTVSLPSNAAPMRLSWLRWRVAARGCQRVHPAGSAERSRTTWKLGATPSRSAVTTGRPCVINGFSTVIRSRQSNGRFSGPTGSLPAMRGSATSGLGRAPAATK